MFERVSERKYELMTKEGRMTQWNDGRDGWMVDWIKKMNRWMSSKMNEWMNERVNE